MTSFHCLALVFPFPIHPLPFIIQRTPAHRCLCFPSHGCIAVLLAGTVEKCAFLHSNQRGLPESSSSQALQGPNLYLLPSPCPFTFVHVNLVDSLLLSHLKGAPRAQSNPDAGVENLSMVLLGCCAAVSAARRTLWTSRGYFVRQLPFPRQQTKPTSSIVNVHIFVTVDCQLLESLGRIQRTIRHYSPARSYSFVVTDFGRRMAVLTKFLNKRQVFSRCWCM